jgi:hypothetical protein
LHDIYVESYYPPSGFKSTNFSSSLECTKAMDIMPIIQMSFKNLTSLNNIHAAIRMINTVLME